MCRALPAPTSTFLRAPQQVCRKFPSCIKEALHVNAVSKASITHTSVYARWVLLSIKAVAGVTIQAPQLDINTVAAGGGSRLFYRTGVFQVLHPASHTLQSTDLLPDPEAGQGMYGCS